MKLNLNDRDRRAVRLGAILLGVVLIVRLGVMPWINHWQAVRLRSEAKQLEAIGSVRKAERLSEIDRRIEKRYGPAATKPLKDTQQAALAFHKAIIKLMQSNGIKIDSLQPQAARTLRDAPGMSLLTMRVAASGQPPQVIKALSALRDPDCLMFIDRMELTTDPKKPGQMSLNLTLGTLAKGGLK